jgi:hypothetical protein
VKDHCLSAQDCNLAYRYLPFNDIMREYLTEHPSTGPLEFDKAKMASTLAIIGNRYFHQNGVQVAKRNNLQLTRETAHLNQKGENGREFIV